MSDSHTSRRIERFIEPKETDEERERRLSDAEIKRNKDRGLTQFFYGTNSVWAINKSVADKKAKKKGYV